MSDHQKLARETLAWYVREINEAALPATEQTEILLRVPVLASAVLEQQKTITRMEKALQHARLDLTALHGLYAFDGEAPAEVWQLSNSKVIAHIDRALGEDV